MLFTGGIGPIPKGLLQQNGVRLHTVRERISDLLTKIDVIMVADDGVPFVSGEICHGGPRVPLRDRIVAWGVFSSDRQIFLAAI